MPPIPDLRLRAANAAPPRPGADYVLYWMIAARRTRSSFALAHAVERAHGYGVPLVVFEPLRAGYPWASDRLHRFVLDGMADNAESLRASPAHYYPYVEPAPGAGRGLLEALAERAALVVADEYPGYFLPRMVETAARRLAVRLDAVDGNGVLPLRASAGDFATAFAFRRFAQKLLPIHLADPPPIEPLRDAKLRRLEALPLEIETRWPRASAALLDGDPVALAALPIDHRVPPTKLRGGARAAGEALDGFVSRRLARYAEDRNHPDLDATSGLSPYLHFGHVAAHEVVTRVLAAEQWRPDRLSARAAGKREGWWGVSPSAEGFLDQIVTWRELGFHTARHRPDYDRYGSLPEWARATLARHAGDERPWRYGFDALDAARTHDPLWNAAQRQLRREGRLHNYLRMLWGKKILEWSDTPEEALGTMIELNDRYALDGRDPNSISGIFWTLGRYDRPWFPERPVYGTIRYMSSQNTARKCRVRAYLERYGEDGGVAAAPELF